MFKSITVDGKPIKRVVSNGQTIWRKAENILTTTIRFDIQGFGKILDLSDPVLMNYSPSEMSVLNLLDGGLSLVRLLMILIQQGYCQIK
ncbi:Uncharacterised protein [Alloiococcus otitis]|uniref:hypothetical protein n=1 Tax=Alloiococcus otitis TaxID=1652 RepID=UPI000E16DA1F|nr:hypothetical protein [Alloiococcus otitis]SUU91716.1 Uncharacterised protein [Alloiococcus otitis]